MVLKKGIWKPVTRLSAPKHGIIFCVWLEVYRTGQSSFDLRCGRTMQTHKCILLVLLNWRLVMFTNITFYIRYKKSTILHKICMSPMLYHIPTLNCSSILNHSTNTTTLFLLVFCHTATQLYTPVPKYIPSR